MKTMGMYAYKHTALNHLMQKSNPETRAAQRKEETLTQVPVFFALTVSYTT